MYVKVILSRELLARTKLLRARSINMCISLLYVICIVMVYGAGISIVNMLEYTDILALEVCVCVASGSMHALGIQATAW